MQFLWRVLAVAAATWLTMLSLAQAAVVASVDKNPVQNGDTVLLTIRVVDEKGEPDLAVLNQNFRVLGQSTNSQMQIVNGEMSRWKDWQVQLLPLRSGELEIPAIRVGQAVTAPLVLSVQERAADAPREVWIDANVSATEVWQGQQLLLTLELYYDSTVRSGELNLPTVNGAFVEPLGEDQTQQMIKNGVRVNRLTRRYLVFPERAGALRIPAAVFSGQAEQAAAPNRGFGSLFRNTRHVSALADELTIQVKPPEVGAPFWLPAQDVTLQAQWVNDQSGSPRFKVGEPITRRVTLTAYGLLATQLPELDLQYPGFRAYPEAAEQQSQATANGVVGVRHFRTALIPQQVGEQTLPAVTVRWWDVTRAEWAEAQLPAQTITVLPADKTAAAAPVAPAPCETNLVAAPAAVAAAESAPLQCSENDAFNTGPSTMWLWLLAALWLLTTLAASGFAYLWWRLRQQLQPSAEPVNVSLQHAKQQLLAAATANDLPAAVAYLAAVSRAAGLAVSSPAAIAQSLQKQPACADLVSALEVLDGARYGGASDWCGDELAAALKATAWPQEGSSQGSKKHSVLAPLYPQF